MKISGTVYLVGAGPGDLGLVTLRAQELIQQADVLVYDYLCNAEMLRWARADAEKIYAGKSGSHHVLTQEQINALLVEKAHAGKTVVRLKGGDPYVFGRGGEEAQALVAEGVNFVEVPGITSAIAAPAYAGIPVTHRDYTSMVTFITGHEDPEKPDSALDWSQLARLRGTKIFLMGVERIRAITEKLLTAGADQATPVALVRWGTTPRQETVEGTLATIADIVVERGFKAPAITIMGDVVKLRRDLNWYEALPLLGKRIVVTRTRTQASQLSEKLRRLGADVLEIPTIRIVPQSLKAEQVEKLNHLEKYFSWLLFTSPNAVDAFFADFFQQQQDIRALGAVKIGAVGPATRRKLEALHLRVDVQPATFTATSLARAFPDDLIPGQRFILPQGRLAGAELADYLRQRSGLVEAWTVYDTQPETEDITGARARYLREGAHAITFTSSSTVENWQALQLQPEQGTPQPKIVCMGPVTRATLLKLGYPDILESSEATIDSLVETLRQML